MTKPVPIGTDRATPAPIRRVLVANRGEIAVRIVRACRAHGVGAVVTVSEADIDSLAARLADDVVHIGPPSPTDSYLRVEQVIAAALLTECDAIHPGYGFLSERPELADACAAHGLTFVGPPGDVIRRGGDKLAARTLARAVGVPVGGGSDAVDVAAAAGAVADRIGYPVLLKAAAGGGGTGMVRVDHPDELATAYATAAAAATAAFGDGRLYIERFVERARHVEVQILADAHGSVVHVGTRDCSVQRRYQKLVEEAPAPGLPAGLHEQLGEAAVAIGRGLGYVGAGTVEFLVDVDRDQFSFLEVNTRIQVEHPVTEMITGIDLVREQLRIAEGHPLSIGRDEIAFAGHAIECRINAESPTADFAPSPGTIARWRPPTGDHIRLDTQVAEGDEIPPFYDSLIAKLIVWGPDRTTALERLANALAEFAVDGVDTTVDLHRTIVTHPEFVRGEVTTGWLESTLLPEFDRIPTTAPATEEMSRG